MRNKYQIVRRPMRGKKETVSRIFRREHGLHLLEIGEPRVVMILQRATRKRTTTEGWRKRPISHVVWREIARREGNRGKVIFAGA